MTVGISPLARESGSFRSTIVTRLLGSLKSRIKILLDEWIWRLPENVKVGSSRNASKGDFDEFAETYGLVARQVYALHPDFTSFVDRQTSLHPKFFGHQVYLGTGVEHTNGQSAVDFRLDLRERAAISGQSFSRLDYGQAVERGFVVASFEHCHDFLFPRDVGRWDALSLRDLRQVLSHCWRERKEMRQVHGEFDFVENMVHCSLDVDGIFDVRSESHSRCRAFARHVDFWHGHGA